MKVEFDVLSLRFAEFNKFYNYETKEYDFSTHEGLCCLTKCILKHYFDLDVELSSENLCPRIPNRVAYLDLVSEKLINFNKDATLLDIGTGHCAIYLLLLSKLTNWNLVGTEIDPESVRRASHNIGLNNLQERIQLILQKSPDEIVPEMNTVNPVITICNPPFYANMQEMNFKSEWKQEKRSELRANYNELITEGGELQFIEKMILQSLQHQSIKWFTSLVGNFDNLTKIAKMLKKEGIYNFFSDKLMEDKWNRTQRWVIGWSFQPERTIIRTRSNLPNIGLVQIPTPIPVAQLVETLTKSGIESHVTRDRCVEMRVKRDTWSRRARRGGNSVEDISGIVVEIE